MTLLAILIFITLATLLLVSILNRIQQRQRQRRQQQRRLRLQVEALQDMLQCLEQTLANPTIARHINDRIIDLLNQILALEDRHTEHIETAIHKAEAYANQLTSPGYTNRASYQRDSDAQIAKSQAHLLEVIDLMPHLAVQGKISEVELDIYRKELRWAHLMVAVMSFVAQGDKCMAISDRFSAQAFYRKAQQLLMESLDPDPRRLKLIKELSELIDGSRNNLSRDLSEPKRLSLA